MYRHMWAQLGLLASVPAMLAAQEGTTISGRVTGEGSAALSAATVSISELGLGALTRDDGRYIIVVPAARMPRQAVTVTARRVGYKPRSLKLAIASGAITQDFAL